MGMNIEQGGGKGGKGKGGGGGAGTTVSMLNGWLKFRTDPSTAEHLQTLRLSLHQIFQKFCQRAGDIPPRDSLSVVDNVAALLSGGALDMDDDEPRGVKRAANWEAGESSNKRAKGGGKGKYDGGKGGKGGKGYGKGKGKW